MAVLQLEGGETYTDLGEISRQFSALNILVQHLPLQQYLVNPEIGQALSALLSQEILNLAQKQEVLQALSPKFAAHQYTTGYTWCELMAVNPSSSQLYHLLAQGSRPHCYPNDESLYILTGECIFGFSHPDGFRMELLLQTQDYIKVPAGIRHWFSLSASLQLKAVRYFTTARQTETVACPQNR